MVNKLFVHFPTYTELLLNESYPVLTLGDFLRDSGTP